MATQGQFENFQNFPEKEVDMIFAVYEAMEQVNNTERENPVNKKALKMLKKFSKIPFLRPVLTEL